MKARLLLLAMLLLALCTALPAGAAPQPPAQPALHVVQSSPTGPKPTAPTAAVQPAYWTISLSSSNYYPFVGQYFYLTAYTNHDVGPTPYDIEFYQGSRQLGYCTYGTGCRLRVQATSPGTAYVQARVAYPNGSGSVAYSNTVVIHIHY